MSRIAEMATSAVTNREKVVKSSETERKERMDTMLKHMIDMGLSSEERQKGIYFAESLEQIIDILCSLKED